MPANSQPQHFSEPIKYFSTRDHSGRLSFEEAVLTGLAPDGGLYIPVHLPALPEDWQTAWSKLSFTQLALELYSLFISEAEIPRADLKRIIDKSFGTFRHPKVTPIKRVGEKEWILELFHGPTFAFKDVALQFLGNLFEFFMTRKNEGKQGKDRQRLTVIGATSGDTGSAAIYGLRSKQDVSIFILHPKGRVSPIQEAQMTTVADENVFNLAVDGTFDDCQDIVKELFGDKEFNSKYNLGAVNSINWARILAQTVYYFASYFQIQRQLPYGMEDATIQYTVPTGNFGDILAGYYAKRLGLPMEKLVIATNANDILARFWKTGRYEKVDSGVKPAADSLEVPDIHEAERVAAEAAASQENLALYEEEPAPGTPKAPSKAKVAETLSPAMDILVSSNFERLLFYLALEGCSSTAVAADGEVDGGQHARTVMAGQHVKKWMDQLKTDGRVVVPRAAVEAARRDFVADRVSDVQTTETIRAFYEKKDDFGSYVSDPHTAVGLAVAARVAKSNAANTVQVVLSTAHPAKFNEAVSAALVNSPGFDFARDVLPKEFEGLLDLPRRVIDVDGTSDAIKDVVQKELKHLFDA